MKPGKLIRLWQDTDTGDILTSKENENCVSLNLAVEETTGIVYFKFTERAWLYQRLPTQDCHEQETLNHDDSEQDPAEPFKVGYMSPYLGPNAKCCKLVSREIVEVNN